MACLSLLLVSSKPPSVFNFIMHLRKAVLSCRRKAQISTCNEEQKKEVWPLSFLLFQENLDIPFFLSSTQFKILKAEQDYKSQRTEYSFDDSVTCLGMKFSWNSSDLKIKTRVPTLTTTIQHSFGSFSHSNQRIKRNKRNPDWKRRSKTLRWHDPLHRKP